MTDEEFLENIKKNDLPFFRSYEQILKRLDGLKKVKQTNDPDEEDEAYSYVLALSFEHKGLSIDKAIDIAKEKYKTYDISPNKKYFNKWIKRVNLKDPLSSKQDYAARQDYVTSHLLEQIRAVSTLKESDTTLIINAVYNATDDDSFNISIIEALRLADKETLKGSDYPLANRLYNTVYGKNAILKEVKKK